MPESSSSATRAVAVIGGGPAGLMAAEVLSAHGVQVDVYDAMPSVGRKFLMAGKGGMNITHAEPFASFLSRYGARQTQLQAMLQAFPPDALRAWIHGLGIATFVGTSGRVFPTDMKAAPLLRAWLHRLRERGVRLHMRHRWLGWGAEGDLMFETPEGRCTLAIFGHRAIPFPHPSEAVAASAALQIRPTPCGCNPLPARGTPMGAPLLRSDPTPAPEGEGINAKNNCVGAVVLALGGGSWPQLGSDGNWISLLQAKGVELAPLRPANCGFEIAWSDFFKGKFAGQPLKAVVASFTDEAGIEHRKQGDCVVTQYGIEGGLIYALSAPLRDTISTRGNVIFCLDLLPGKDDAKVLREVSHPRGSRSLSSHLHSRLGLSGVHTALLHEVLSKVQMQDAAIVAKTIKALPLALHAPRPLAEAISSAGGVSFESLDENLMLKDLPGVFCAGEMLDWEAPTGGYLLTACFASGRQAAEGVLSWLKIQIDQRIV